MSRLDEPNSIRALASAGIALVFPGAGHFFLGRRKRALVYAAVIFFLFGVGLAVDGRVYRVEPGSLLSVLALFAQLGMGLPFWIVRFGTEITGDIVSATYEHGTTFLITAGLMNHLLAIDAFDIAQGRKP